MACPADQVRAEAETLRSMHNANLHRVVESFEDFNSIYIISELVDSIRLLAFLRSQYDAKFEITESWVSQVMRQVLEALGFCHQKKPRSIVHGDLGMDSVGLASISDPATSPHVIISDLALAGILSSPGNKFCDLPATPWWRHDQSLEAELEQCGPKQDVWACGCLLYILLSGCMPLKTNEICFGGPFHPPEKSSFYDIEWSHLRHASAQAEAFCVPECLKATRRSAPRQTSACATPGCSRARRRCCAMWCPRQCSSGCCSTMPGSGGARRWRIK